VGVICIKGNKQDKKCQLNYKRHKIEPGQKEDYPKDPLIGPNGGLNNKQITLKGLVI
jgi:hypothetical protein